MVDTVSLTQASFTSFSSLCGLMTVVPEQLDQQPPVIDVLNGGEYRNRGFYNVRQINYIKVNVSHLDVAGSGEISQYEIQEESFNWNIHLSEMAGKGCWMYFLIIDFFRWKQLDTSKVSSL